MAVTANVSAQVGGESLRVAAGFGRRAGGVALAGIVGVLALLVSALPPDVMAQQPALANWPAWAVKALLALNPALLVLAAAALGAAVAHRVGLRSACAGTISWHHAASTLRRPLATGLALGLVLAAVDAALRPLLGDSWQRLAAAHPTGAPALASALLYGGLAEEVMLRWGLMSGAAWLLATLLGPARRRTALWGAIVIAAALFAAGHLPALAAQIELSPAVVARTLVLNGLAGMVYGWYFWRQHLEGAMAAHAATHLGWWTWRSLAG